MNTKHDKKVLNLISFLKSCSSGKSYSIKKSNVSHFVPNPDQKRDKMKKVDICDFIEILGIDPEAKTCTAESGVTFSKLVRQTMKYNLIPHTVPELKGITIGGAVSGCSIESMSYKYGGLHDSCIEYELVTPKGEVKKCSNEENPDLFHMIHGSYGTLGLLTKIKLKLLPAKPFVRVKYITLKTFDEFWKYMYERCEKGEYDFIDGIIHSKDKFVVCLGQMTDTAPYISKYTWTNIYYKSTTSKEEDYLSIYDYFFRYDTECHWMTKTVPLMENKLVRFLVGKIVLGSDNLIKWSKRLKHVMKLKRRPEVVVDVFIPSTKFSEFYSWYETSFNFYPLWIVPYKIDKPYPWINNEYAKTMDSKLMIDCAVYGKKNSDPGIDYSEILEKKVSELNGIKTLISRNHYKKEDFWKIYNQQNYSSIKNRVDPNGLFSDLYEKFKPVSVGVDS
jgi:FAD/FMN-containing dehydrogenase